MNYLPFKDLEVGAFFRELTDNALCMKTSAPDEAILMESVYTLAGSGHRLLPRGHCLKLQPNTCVSVEATESVLLPFNRQDPRDPGKSYWDEGACRLVGERRQRPVKVFAGLFLYSGLGAGQYYSNTGECLFLSADDAEKIADKEGAPFVFHDSFQLTTDEELARKRVKAEEALEKKKAQPAE